MSIYMDEVKKCLSEHKDEIVEINNSKTKQSRNLSDEKLQFLWAYYMNQMDICAFLSCFDLTRKEYAYCTYKIFGIKSAKLFLKRTKKDASKWNDKTRRRLATEIVLTYRRRGQHFLRDVLIPKNPNSFKREYLNCYGFLEKNGREKAEELILALQGGNNDP